MDLQNPIATIQLESGEVVKIMLFPSVAPNTVNSFICLANRGKYNHKKIRRVVKDYLIQPDYHYFDDPDCDYFIDLEIKKMGPSFVLPLDKYVVSMAVNGEGLASGSEFFFSMGDNDKRLSGIVPSFGKVTEGFEVLDRIENVKTKQVVIDVPGVLIYEPLCAEIISSITVETFGKKYPEPIKAQNQDLK